MYTEFPTNSVGLSVQRESRLCGWNHAEWLFTQQLVNSIQLGTVVDEQHHARQYQQKLPAAKFEQETRLVRP